MMTLIKSNTDPPPKKANYRTKVMVVEIWRSSPFNTLDQLGLDNWPKISHFFHVNYGWESGMLLRGCEGEV